MRKRGWYTRVPEMEIYGINEIIKEKERYVIGTKGYKGRQIDNTETYRIRIEIGRGELGEKYRKNREDNRNDREKRRKIYKKKRKRKYRE